VDFFFRHREGGMVFYQIFLLYPLSKVTENWTGETVGGYVSLKKQKSQGKAVEVTVNSKEENFLRLLSGFCPRIRPLDVYLGPSKSRGWFLKCVVCTSDLLLNKQISSGSWKNHSLPIESKEKLIENTEIEIIM
jgi:hypothetical protein